MYIKVINGSPVKYKISQFRRDNPSVSFPKEISLDILASYYIYPYVHQSIGDYNTFTHQVVEDVITIIDGVWTQTYSVDQLPSEQVASNVREQRNTKLAECDWTACSDVTMPEAMTTYRQALRDITTQTNFPWEVTWPTQPE